MLCLDRGECHRGRTPGHPEAESVESTAPRSWGASQVKGSGRRRKACHHVHLSAAAKLAALLLDACDAAQEVGNRFDGGR